MFERWLRRKEFRIFPHYSSYFYAVSIKNFRKLEQTEEKKFLAKRAKAACKISIEFFHVNGAKKFACSCHVMYDNLRIFAANLRTACNVFAYSINRSNFRVIHDETNILNLYEPAKKAFWHCIRVKCHKCHLFLVAGRIKNFKCMKNYSGTRLLVVDHRPFPRNPPFVALFYG